MFGFCSLAVVSGGVSGCTVIGLGTGAVVDVASAPKYEKRSASSASSIAPGTTVVLHAKDGGRTQGELLGMSRSHRHPREPYVVVEQENGVTGMRQAELRYVAVEQPKRAWLYGGAIGLCLDMLTIALFAAFYDPSYDASEWSSASGTGGW
jgi:hypothetical protein